MLKRLLFVLLVVLPLAMLQPSFAAEERYDYDELGRLIRAVLNGSTSTVYRYDPAGNLLEITLTAAESPPSIPGLGFDSLRCGSETDVTLAGEEFAGVRITTTSPMLQTSNLRYTDTGVTFTLAVDCNGEPGEYALLFTNAAGTTSVTIRINPQLPEIFITPAPLAVPPDGSTRNILLRLSHADAVEHALSISSSNEGLVHVLTPQLTIPAGATEVVGQVSGITAGQAHLEITSSTLATRLVPVYITTDFSGVNTSYAPLLGVTSIIPPAPVPEREVQLSSSNVGVNLGNVISGLSPGTLHVDSGPTQVVVSGSGLSQATSVELRPNDGLVVSSPVADAVGESVAFSVTVADSAEPTLRQVIVRRDDGTPYVAVAAGADRLKIAYPAPHIESVSPIVLYPGDTAVPLTIRGSRLLDVEAVTISPPDAISIDHAVVVDPNGEVLEARVSVSPEVQPGARVVTVTTAGGVSDAAASPANTVHIALENVADIQALTAAMIGVDKGIEGQLEEREQEAYGLLLGVLRPPIVMGIEPSVGVIGTTVELILEGVGLGAVDALQFLPDTGLSVSPPTVAPDGKSVSATLTIAEDAPMTTREVQVLADASAVPFASAETGRFEIVPPPPLLNSVSPIYLQTGVADNLLALHGMHFREAVVSIEPSHGITVGGHVVSDEETRLSVQVGVSQDAEPGPRWIEVITPGGSSGTAASVRNTVNVITEPGPTYESIVGPGLGVVRLVDDPEPVPENIPVRSSFVGVTKNAAPIDIATEVTPLVAAIGVAKGPLITDRSPAAALPGDVVDFVLSGDQLTAASVEFAPSDYLEFVQLPAVDPDGAALRFSIAVEAGAPPSIRRLIVNNEDGSVVPFLDPRHTQFEIGYGAPEIDSIEPILARQGDVTELVVRGRNLFKAFEVFPEPSSGLRFSPYIDVNESGTQLTVRMAVDEDAPLGSRVIRTAVPGATSTDVASPANTFTVYETIPQ